MRPTALDIVTAACCGIFIGILALAAWWDPSIRWLHAFQALLYVAIATAGFWNYTTLFLNNFFHAGREQLSILLSTGQLPRPDLLIAVPAVAAHFVMIGCCLWGYVRLPEKDWRDVGRAAACTALSVGYFALIMALFQPRYLGLFTRVLHPHLSL